MDVEYPSLSKISSIPSYRVIEILSQLSQSNENIAEEMLIFDKFLERGKSKHSKNSKKTSRPNTQKMNLDSFSIGMKEKMWVVQKCVDEMFKLARESKERDLLERLELLAELEEHKMEKKELVLEREDFIRYYRRKMDTKTAILKGHFEILFEKKERQQEKFNLLCQKMKKKLKVYTRSLKKNSAIGDNVKKIHLECLEIENSRIRSKIEGINKKIQKIKKDNSKIRVLTREAMQSLTERQKNFEKIQKKIQTRKRILTRTKKNVISITTELSKSKNDQKKFFSRVQNFKNVPNVNTYIYMMRNLREKQKNCESWKRKADIVKHGRKVYGRYYTSIEGTGAMLETEEQEMIKSLGLEDVSNPSDL